MKIKKIMIQAFKSYLHVKDGTFDFSINEHETANFISIYAPNGFGKTSFCDAVDYAITSKIHRYSRIKKIETSNREEIKFNNVQGERQFLIRNTHADDSLETKVIVEVNNRTIPFESVYKTPRIGQADYKVECEANKETAFFENTMLYQEAIDSFLRESNAESRFAKFAENDKELLDISNKRATLVTLKRDIEKNIKDNETEQLAVTQSIANLKDKVKDFTTVNSHIDELNSSTGEMLLSRIDVDQHFSHDMYESYKQSLLSINKNIEWQLNDLNLKQNNYITHTSYLPLYVQFNKERIELSKEITSIDESILLKKKSSSLIEEIQRLTNTRNRFSEKATRLKSLNASVRDYIEDLKLLGELTQKKISNKRQSDVTEQKLNLLQSTVISLDALIQDERKRQHDAQNSINTFEIHFNEISSLESKIESINSQSLKLITERDLIKKAASESEFFVKVISNIKIDISTPRESIFFLQNEQQSKIINYQEEYDHLLNEKTSLQTKIENLNLVLSQTNNYNNELKHLLDRVSKIVIRTNQNNCPVCGHVYKEYSQLKEKIITNPLFNEQEKIILNEISIAENQQLSLNDKISNLLVDFNTYLNDIKSNFTHQERTLKDTRESLLDKLNSLTEIRESTSAEIERLKTKVQFSTYDELIEKKSNEIQKTIHNIAFHEKEKYGVEEQITIEKSNLHHLNDSIRCLDEEVKLQVGKVSSYKYIIDFIKETNIINDDEDMIRKTLNEKSNELEGIINSCESSIVNLNNDLNIVASKMPITYTNDSTSQLEEKKKTALDKIKIIISQLSEFEFIASYLNIAKEDQFKIELIESELKKQTDAINLNINSLNHNKFLSEVILDLMGDLVGCEGLSKLEFKNKELQSKNKAAKYMYNEIGRDIEKLGDYIKNKVDMFFKTDLINQLYQMVDPHPEYKNIRFECNTDEKPKLLIKAESLSGINCTSPMLSFSSAQINVLALSIFLARALHVKDANGKSVDCIFIDDPVQSIDSINTLSLIDLFRAIIVKFNKQIIITTHDENFHALLKRKIPSSSFPSKYLRLISFGKVAIDHN